MGPLRAQGRPEASDKGDNVTFARGNQATYTLKPISGRWTGGELIFKLDSRYRHAPVWPVGSNMLTLYHHNLLIVRSAGEKSVCGCRFRAGASGAVTGAARGPFKLADQCLGIQCRRFVDMNHEIAVHVKIAAAMRGAYQLLCPRQRRLVAPFSS